MQRISQHISYKEATFSQTAIRKDIDNIPSEEILERMRIVAENIFEPLRAHVGGPIKINSFYRSIVLNTAIGGSKSSQHTRGEAIDLDDTLGCMSNKDMFTFIKDELDFDQLIWEFGDDENPAWVHVSYVSPENNRRRILKAEKINGKTTYNIMKV
jgi:zinc D-Ala-D-Ala carboxypeptidase